MNSKIDDFERRIADTATQLQAVEVTFADDASPRRTEYLEEVLERALKGVLPEQRREFLLRLRERFPAWDAASAPAVATPPPAAPAPQRTLDPEELVAQLVAVGEQMDDAGRANILESLRAGGLVPESEESSSEAHAANPAEVEGLPRQAREALQYLMNQMEIDELDLTRAVKVMLLAIEYMTGSEQLIWRTWRTIAPRSAFRRPSDLRKQLADYLRGDRKIGGLAVKGSVDRLRLLTASLIAAVGQAGGDYARTHLAQIAPGRIEAQVNREGGSLLVSKEVRCWNLYEKLAHDLTEENVEHAIRQAITERAEALLNKTAS